MDGGLTCSLSCWTFSCRTIRTPFSLVSSSSILCCSTDIVLSYCS